MLSRTAWRAIAIGKFVIGLTVAGFVGWWTDRQSWPGAAKWLVDTMLVAFLLTLTAYGPRNYDEYVRSKR